MSSSRTFTQRARSPFGLLVVVFVLAQAQPSSAQTGGRPTLAPRSVVTEATASPPAPAPTPSRRPRTPIGPLAIPGVVAGGSALALGLALYLTPGHPAPPSASTWRGGVFIDEGVRDGLRLRAPDARAVAATLSDALMIATMLNAVAIDAITIPLIQDDPHLAWQASAAYSLALGVTLALNDVVKEVVGRARPYERECQSDPTAPGCSSPDTYASFYSGHTAVAFTSAGFSCAMHLSRSLYGDQGADAAACGGSLALAAATGLLRIVSDRHYLSDVLVGALIGFVVGYIAPLIFVPERRTPPRIAAELDPDDEGIAAPLPGPSVMVTPTFSPGPTGLGSGSIGLSVSGTF